MSKRISRPLLATVAVLLNSCASTGQSPVETRGDPSADDPSALRIVENWSRMNQVREYGVRGFTQAAFLQDWNASDPFLGLLGIVGVSRHTERTEFSIGTQVTRCASSGAAEACSTDGREAEQRLRAILSGPNMGSRMWHTSTARVACTLTFAREVLMDRVCGMPPNPTGMVSAVVRGDSVLVRAMLRSGVDANLQHDLGFTPLHYAALSGRVNIMASFLDAGADPNITNSRGATPLHLAVILGAEAIEATELLLESGGDPNVSDERGWTPLDLAEMLDREGLARLLRSPGAQ